MTKWCPMFAYQDYPIYDSWAVHIASPSPATSKIKKNDCTPVGIGSVDRKSLYNKIEVQWKGDVVGMGEVPI